MKGEYKEMKFKKIFVPLLVILAIWIFLLGTDCLLPTLFNKKPVFSIWTVKEKDGGSGVYQGLGYSIKIKGNFMPEHENNIYYTQIKIFNIFTHTVNKI